MSIEINQGVGSVYCLSIHSVVNLGFASVGTSMSATTKLQYLLSHLTGIDNQF